MTLNQFMRKIGYISEKNLITVALEVYDNNCTEKATDEKNFTFDRAMLMLLGISAEGLE